MDNTTVDIELTGAIIQNNSKQLVSGTNYKLYTAQHFGSPYNMTQGTLYYQIEPSFMVKMNVTKTQIFYPSTAGGYKELTGPLPGFPSTVYPANVSNTSDFPSGTTIVAKVSIPDDNTVTGVDSSKNWKVVVKMTPLEKPLTFNTSYSSHVTFDTMPNVLQGTEKTLTVTANANDGYIFDSSKLAFNAYKQVSGTHYLITGSNYLISSDKTKITLTIPYDGTNNVDYIDIRVTAVPKPLPNIQLNLSSDSQHVTITPTGNVNTKTDFTLTADNNYLFTELGIYGQYVAGVWKQLGTVPATNTGTTTVTIDPADFKKDTELILSITPVSTTKTISINSADFLENATISPEVDTITKNTEFTLTANTGFEFSENGAYGLDSFTGLVDPQTVITANNDSTLKFTLDIMPYDDGSTVDIKMSATKKTISQIPVDQSKLINATSDLTSARIPVAKTTVTLTATAGYMFNDTIVIEYVGSDSIVNTDRITGNKTGVQTITIDPTAENNPTAKINIVAQATKTVVKSYLVFNTDKVENATANIANGIHLDLSMDHTILFTANTGYIFDKDGQAGYYTKGGVYQTIKLNATDSDTISFTLPKGADGQRGTNLDVTLIARPIKIDSGGFTNIYNPTNEDMNDLSQEIIVNNNGKEVSPTDYMKNYYRMPFPISASDISSAKVAISLGGYQSRTKTKQVNTDNLTVDLGKIIIPEKYKNAFDYLNTTCVLYLPAIAPININSKLVINHTLNIQYNIDLYSGQATVNIYDENANNIYHGNNVVSTQLPILDTSTEKVIATINHPYLNDLRTGYIIVTRNKPIQNDVYYPTLIRDTLNNHTGYVKCSNIQLNNNIATNIQLDIKQKLSEGVLIK